MSPNAESPVRPEKRRRTERVTAACDLCKKRKVKCDGQQPCEYCMRKKLSATCTFTAPRTQIRGASVSHTPNEGGVGNGNASHGRTHSAGHTPRNLQAARLSPQPEHRHEGHEFGASRTGTSSSPTLSREDHQGDTAVPLEGRILRDAQGKLIFIGDCAPLSFLQTVRHLITSEIDSGFSVQTTRDPIIEIAHSTRSIQQHTCPPIDVHRIESILADYLAATSGLVDLFQREKLEGELKAWASNQATHVDDSAAAVSYLVLAIGAQESLEDQAEAWFQHAREMLLKNMCNSMHVATVQGFTLVAIYMLRAFQPNGAYLYFSLAARTAYAIGIHRTEVNASFGEPIRIVRDRIWRSLRIVDQLISNALGRPPSTSDVDCTVKYSLEETGRTDVDVLNASVQILMIVERVVVEVYSRKRISLRIAEYVSHQLKSWASKWLRNLSKITTSANSAPREAVAGACSTLCSYYYGIMLLTRPFLIYELYEYLGASMRNGATQGDHQAKRKYADAALEAASSLVDTLQTIIRTGQLPRRMPLIVSWLFTAGLVLAVGILGDSGMTMANSCEDSITCLDYFGEADPHARQYSLVIQSLLKITSAHAKNREVQMRSKRKQATSELFGLLQSEPRVETREGNDALQSQPLTESLFSQSSGTVDLAATASMDWTIYDANFFALPWPNENDQGLQDFLQPGTHIDGESIADIPLFPIHDQQTGDSYFS